MAPMQPSIQQGDKFGRFASRLTETNCAAQDR
jgi:hypothetical protein